MGQETSQYIAGNIEHIASDLLINGGGISFRCPGLIVWGCALVVTLVEAVPTGDDQERV